MDLLKDECEHFCEPIHSITKKPMSYEGVKVVRIYYFRIPAFMRNFLMKIWG